MNHILLQTFATPKYLAKHSLTSLKFLEMQYNFPPIACLKDYSPISFSISSICGRAEATSANSFSVSY